MKKNKHTMWRFLYKLHRYVGLSSAIVLLMLAVTGIALNHTEFLKLDSQTIQSDIILDWYGIHAPDDIKSFSTNHYWLTQIDQKIYFDHSMLLQTTENLRGVIETNAFIVVALSHSIHLLSLEGELIEQIPFDAIEKIGLNAQQTVIIQSNQKTVGSSDGLLSWHPQVNQIITWSTPSQAPREIISSLKNNFRSSILPMERMLLDLHSGRLFGSIGVIVVDLCGVLLIILVFSGCAVGLKHKFRALHLSLKSYLKR